MHTINKRLTRVTVAALLAGLGACDGTRTTDPNAPGVLSFSLSEREAPADGASVVQVTAAVHRNTRGDARKLTFSTGSGSFLEGAEKTLTVTADENGLARVGLRAPVQPGLVRVRVSAGTVERVDSVFFTRALPEQVLVDVEKFAVSAGIRNEVRVTALLRRGSGAVTPGTTVSFRAVREGTQEAVGQFGIPTLSDAGGQVTARYTPGNTPYRGRVMIVATATGAGGPVAGQAVIEVID
jgi:hypothetical protein